MWAIVSSTWSRNASTSAMLYPVRIRLVPNRASRTSCALKVTISTLKQDDKIDEYLNPEYQNEKCQIERYAAESQRRDHPSKGA